MFAPSLKPEAMATAVKVFRNFAVDGAFTMDSVKEIRIVDHLDSNRGITFDDAEPIYNMIIKAFNSGQRVVLDFEGIKMMTTVFLDQMLGRVYEKYSSNQLKKMLEFSHISPSTAIRIEQVEYNVKLYLADPEGYAKIIEDGIYGEY